MSPSLRFPSLALPLLILSSACVARTVSTPSGGAPTPPGGSQTTSGEAGAATPSCGSPPSRALPAKLTCPTSLADRCASAATGNANIPPGETNGWLCPPATLGAPVDSCSGETVGWSQGVACGGYFGVGSSGYTSDDAKIFLYDVTTRQLVAVLEGPNGHDFRCTGGVPGFEFDTTNGCLYVDPAIPMGFCSNRWGGTGPTCSSPDGGADAAAPDADAGP